MIRNRQAYAGALVLSTLLLYGCADREEQEAKQWMDEVRRSIPIKVQTVSEPKMFVPFVYAAKSEMDPYNPIKLTAALAKAEIRTNNGISPDLNRRKEALESFPLDSIKMVGTIDRAGTTYALLQADKSLFQARAGNYAGQNFGLITRITEAEVQIKEVVRDAAGDWTERPAKLELQESKK
jgi:type IV pilus assembly protein PilP